DLGVGLAPFATDERLRALEDRVASGVQDFLDVLGIDVDATVGAQLSDANQAIRVRIRGVLQPYPPDLLRRMWLAVAPPSLWDVPEKKTRKSEQGGFPDGWLREYVTSVEQSTDAAAWETVGEFLARVAHEVIQARAAALVGPIQVDEYLRRAASELPEGDGL